MKKQFYYVFWIALIITLAFIQTGTVSATANVFSVGQGIADNKFVSDSRSYFLSDTVVEYDMAFNNTSFSKQTMGYAITVDLLDSRNKAKIAAGYSNCDASEYSLKTTYLQAKDYERNHPGEKVIAGFNADFFDMKTGRPLGSLVMDGTVYHKSNNRNYFAILKDGSAVICNGTRTALNGKRKGNKIPFADVQQAVGGQKLLVKNGKITDAALAYKSSVSPGITAIGIKGDGTVVFYVLRGAQEPVSYGESYAEVAEKMLAFGCKTALMLDGGGSSTFLSERREDSDLVVRNYPCDGTQRQVASTLFIVVPESEAGVGEDEPSSGEKHEHEYMYSADEEKVTCLGCSYINSEHIGMVCDTEGNELYLIKGKPVTGWNPIGENICYFDEKGIRKLVSVKKDVKSGCITNGYITYLSDADDTMTVEYKNTGGHEYTEINGRYRCSVCGTVRTEIQNCNVVLSYNKCTYTGSEKTPSTTVTSPDGKVLTNSGIYRDYYSKYENNIEVGTAAVTVTAIKYGYYVNVNDWRGSYKGARTVYYDIHPDVPQNAYAKYQNGQAVLNWDAATAADGYIIQQNINGTGWKDIGTTKDRQYIADNIKSDAVYKFRILTSATGKDDDGNDKEYRSLVFSEVKDKVPRVIAEHRQTDGKPRLLWEPVLNGVNYEIYRSVSGNIGTFYKQYTTSGRSYINTTAVAGRTYYYKVRAVDKSGNKGEFGAVVKVTCLDTNPIVKVIYRAFDKKTSLRWTAVNRASKYEVYRSKSGKQGTFYKCYITRGCTYTHISAVKGRLYYYKVRAVMDTGTRSVFSKVVKSVAK